MCVEGKIRCLLVDDSALMRAMLKQLLESDPGIQVVDTACSGAVALRKIRDLKPDVVTMDVEMPGMDGIALLREVMKDCPVPVVMVSSHTHDKAKLTLDAMEAGAVDHVAKPTATEGAGLRQIAPQLIAKIKGAAYTNLDALTNLTSPPKDSQSPTTAEWHGHTFDENHVIAIGISCGGPVSLAEIFPRFPAEMPPILITQHMPAGFTKSFANRLDGLSKLYIKEAEHGDVLKPNCVFIAPGHSHMTVARRGGILKIVLDAEEPVCCHRPSVDKLFRSMATVCGSNCTAVIMTGMGNDGAEAIGEIRAGGGQTVAQDKQSSIVYGMPKAAVDLGHIDRVVSLHDIIPTLIDVGCAAA